MSESLFEKVGTITNRFYDVFVERDTNDNIIPDKIEKATQVLKSKGYNVKYSSPGHANTKFKSDRNDDNIVNGKLVSTARVIFEKDYKFKTTPQGWKWKVLGNGTKALYAAPFTYNEGQGSKKEAFDKWRNFYITSLETWANNLPKQGSDTIPEKEDEHFAGA